MTQGPASDAVHVSYPTVGLGRFAVSNRMARRFTTELCVKDGIPCFVLTVSARFGRAETTTNRYAWCQKVQVFAPSVAAIVVLSYVRANVALTACSLPNPYRWSGSRYAAWCHERASVTASQCQE